MKWVKAFFAGLLAFLSSVKSDNKTRRNDAAKAKKIMALQTELETAKQEHAMAVRSGSNSRRIDASTRVKQLSTEIYNLSSGEGNADAR